MMHVVVGGYNSLVQARADRLPGQYLWGTGELERRGATIQIADWNRTSALRRMSQRTRFVAGDLHQEASALRLARPDTTFYSFDVGSFHGLAHWRRPGQRLITIIHPSIRRNRVDRHAYRGIDTAVCLSRRQADELGRGVVLGWGPDLTSAEYADPTDAGCVVSTGKSYRDLRVLHDALTRTRVPAVVYGQPPTGHHTPNVEYRPGGVAHWRTLQTLRTAAIIAIPLRDGDRLAALSELNHALALAKPIIMTRTSWVDIDIDGIGCGVTIPNNHPQTWADAIADLAADPNLRQRMGQRGRRYAEQHWNANRFADGIANIICGPETTLTRRPHTRQHVT